ncbi:hypothetical protein D7319_32240 [Streptomyces radicis]|uniref:Predicted pPIWI-associating nuclease domain-containing protein n=2 Tax=Streptomyces radicis TaxID=1750517 RepID=A0A3A9VPT3_9ACTN|nr:hypothetical protein D7319_32240 [Streptomyces radicis]RKN13026.1 hypothetical protein D7318_32115 [Streptomyces radicis]
MHLANSLADLRSSALEAITQPRVELGALSRLIAPDLSSVWVTHSATVSLAHLNSLLARQRQELGDHFHDSLRGMAGIATQHLGLANWARSYETTTRKLLTQVSELPLRTWHDAVIDLPTDAARSRRAISSGNSVLGLMGGDLLTSDPNLQPEEATVVRVEEDVLQPWERARLEAGDDLKEVLARFAPKAPLFIEEAWKALATKGPLAAEMTAYSITEFIDRTLRAAAPDSDIETWLPQSGVPRQQWYSQPANRLTRPVRIRYIAVRHSADPRMCLALVDNLLIIAQRLNGRLQALKHASEGDLAAVRTLLIAAESFLSHLFLASSPQD